MLLADTRRDIISQYDSSYRHRSHPFVFKLYPLTDGEVHSMVEDVIDQQKYVNRLITLVDHIMGASAKGALLYMLVVLSIFAVLETVVCSLPSHFDESNTEAYTGTLSHVEKYTTWHIGYRAMHSKQHIRLHFTDGNVYFV